MLLVDQKKGPFDGLSALEKMNLRGILNQHIEGRRQELAHKFGKLPSHEEVMADEAERAMVIGRYAQRYGSVPGANANRPVAKPAPVVRAVLVSVPSEPPAVVASEVAEEIETEPEAVVEMVAEEDTADEVERETVNFSDLLGPDELFAINAATQFSCEAGAFMVEREGNEASRREAEHGLPWWTMQSVMHLLGAFIVLILPLKKQVQQLKKELAAVSRTRRSRQKAEFDRFESKLAGACDDLAALEQHMEESSIAEFGIGVLSVLFKQRFEVPDFVMRFIIAGRHRPWPALEAIKIPEMPERSRGKAKRMDAPVEPTEQRMDASHEDKLDELAKRFPVLAMFMDSVMDMAALRLFFIEMARESEGDQKQQAKSVLDWITEVLRVAHEVEHAHTLRASKEDFLRVASMLRGEGTYHADLQEASQAYARDSKLLTDEYPELHFCLSDKLRLAALRLFCIQVAAGGEQIEIGHVELAQGILDWISRALEERHGVDRFEASDLRASDDELTMVAQRLKEDEGFRIMFEGSAVYRQYSRPPSSQRAMRHMNNGGAFGNQMSQVSGRTDDGKSEEPKPVDERRLKADQVRTEIIKEIMRRMDAQQKSLSRPVFSQKKLESYAKRMVTQRSFEDSELQMEVTVEGDKINPKIVQLAMELTRSKAISTGVAYRNAGSSNSVLEARAKLLCRATLDFTYAQLWAEVDAEIERLAQEAEAARQAPDAGLTREEKNPEMGKRMRGRAGSTDPGGTTGHGGTKGAKRRKKGKKK
ncbi:hypothetical protein H6758_04330 [Candidatus Nomurabacteria bacterium]|nr:hypothetical protein [Candidatus Nomurabacteria bacterium]